MQSCSLRRVNSILKRNNNNGDLVTKSCPILATAWTVACQALLFMGFSRQENWSGLPFPPPWDLPDPVIEPGSPELQADSLLTKLQRKPMSNNNEIAMSSIYYVEGPLHMFLAILTTDHLSHFSNENIRLIFSIQRIGLPFSTFLLRGSSLAKVIHMYQLQHICFPCHTRLKMQPVPCPHNLQPREGDRENIKL